MAQRFLAEALLSTSFYLFFVPTVQYCRFQGTFLNVCFLPVCFSPCKWVSTNSISYIQPRGCSQSGEHSSAFMRLSRSLVSWARVPSTFWKGIKKKRRKENCQLCHQNQLAVTPCAISFKYLHHVQSFLTASLLSHIYCTATATPSHNPGAKTNTTVELWRG